MNIDIFLNFQIIFISKHDNFNVALFPICAELIPREQIAILIKGTSIYWKKAQLAITFLSRRYLRGAMRRNTTDTRIYIL